MMIGEYGINTIDARKLILPESEDEGESSAGKIMCPKIRGKLKRRLSSCARQSSREYNSPRSLCQQGMLKAT